MMSVARAYVGGRTINETDKYTVELLSIQTGWTEKQIKECSLDFIKRRTTLKAAIDTIEAINIQRAKNG